MTDFVKTAANFWTIQPEGTSRDRLEPADVRWLTLIDLTDKEQRSVAADMLIQRGRSGAAEVLHRHITSPDGELSLSDAEKAVDAGFAELDRYERTGGSYRRALRTFVMGVLSGRLIRYAGATDGQFLRLCTIALADQGHVAGLGQVEVPRLLRGRMRFGSRLVLFVDGRPLSRFRYLSTPTDWALSLTARRDAYRRFDDLRNETHRALRSQARLRGVRVQEAV